MNADLAPHELDELLHKLYSSLASGTAFEQFLRILLSTMGLEEVVVTGKSGDGGIDLRARRKGIEGLSNIDEVEYYVQAKRLMPGASVSPTDVRALRGVLQDGAVGLFITTGRFSDATRKFADEDRVRPLLLVDGHDVVALSVTHDLGFTPRPEFRPDLFAKMLGGKDGSSGLAAPTAQTRAPDGAIVVSKVVSANDIRSRVLPVPAVIFDHLAPDAKDFRISFAPQSEPRAYSLNRTRKYVAGITDVFRSAGLIDASGAYVSMEAHWTFDRTANTASVSFAPLPSGKPAH